MFGLKLKHFLKILVVLLVCRVIYALEGMKLKIDSMTSFLKFANSDDLSSDVDLVCDLDFSGVTLDSPIGVRKGGILFYRNSVFRGHGHTIKNLHMNVTNSALFFGLANATVRDLHFDDSCSFEGDYAAALFLSYTGNETTLVNVSSAATIHAAVMGGGLFLFTLYSKGTSLTMNDCVNSGDIVVESQSISSSYCSVGGLGANVSGIITMNNCHNHGAVSLEYHGSASNQITTVAVGGLLGYYSYILDSQDPQKFSVTHSKNCSNSGEVSMNLIQDPLGVFVYVGGLVGVVTSTNPGVSLLLRNLKNTGNVIVDTKISACAMRVGGIVGGVEGGSVTIDSCFNYGEIVSTANCKSCPLPIISAGLCAGNQTTITSSMNKGNVFGSTIAVGMAYDCVAIRNSVNSGNVSGGKVSYGIAWNAKTIDGVASKGYTTCRGNGCSYATLNGTNFETWKSLFFLEGLEGAGTEMTIDPVSNRYVVGIHYKGGDDVADIMNGHGHSSGWLWWSGGLEPGYRIVIMNDDLPSAMTRRVFVAEYGETFDEALTREDKAIADFMHDGFCSFQHENKGNPLSSDELIVRDINITVRSVKHVLHFVYTADSLDISINVIHSELPSLKQLSAVKKFMKDDSYAIVEVVNGSNTKIPFNISAAVTEDKEYSIVKLGGVVIIIDLSITNMSNDEIVAAVEELLGDSALSVEVEVEGGELRITVIINEDDTLDVVNELSSTDDERLRDIVRRVYAIGKPESLEISSGIVSTLSSVCLVAIGYSLLL